MKIALIKASNLYNSPYVRYYTDVLDQLGIPYDIFSWNKAGVEEAGVQAFTLKESKNRFCQIIGLFRYQRFIKRKLTEGNYDKVVTFGIFNTALLSSFLKAKYKNNYVFDIRDYSIILKYFRRGFSEAVRNAALVVISSEGFRKWLPKNASYLIRHNTAIAKLLDMLTEIEGKSVCKILTIGLVRDFQANRELIESLANDFAFEMEFVGEGPAVPMLKDLVSDCKTENVRFQGIYAKQDEHKYLVGVSLMNILTNEDINSLTLMTNRFYLSLVYGIPMMVNENTEQAKWVEKYGLGIVVDKKSDIKEQIIRYLQAFDRGTFNAGRKACMAVVQQDIEVFDVKFKEFLRGNY